MVGAQASFKQLLAQLVLSISVPAPASGRFRDPVDGLSHEQLEQLLSYLTDVEFTSEPKNHAAIGSALTALRITGLDTASSTLCYMRKALLDLSQPINLPTVQPSGACTYAGFVDMVGTGGDGQDTFNVSTTASFVAAGVEGMRVCKHGGKASSSTSGSAELLISLGIPLLDVGPEDLGILLQELNCTFLFAPKFHSAMAPLAPIRASLGFPTLFNILGPLINPARPSRGVYGVHSSGLGQTYAEALRLAGMEHVWVCCGQEGLDEISPAGPTDVWEVKDQTITHRMISPEDFGLPKHDLKHVCCGTAAQNAAVVIHLFTNANVPDDGPLKEPLSITAECPSMNLAPIPAGVNLRAIYDYTLLQAASALYVAGFGEGDLKKCTQLARASISDGHALDSLRTLRIAMQKVRARTN